MNDDRIMREIERAQLRGRQRDVDKAKKAHKRSLHVLRVAEDRVRGTQRELDEAERNLMLCRMSQRKG